MNQRLIYLHFFAGILHASTSIMMFAIRKGNNHRKWPLINRHGTNDKKVYMYDISYLLPVFPMLSSVNHFISTMNTSYYEEILKQRINTMRWFEFSISAGVMLWIVATLSGIVEIRSLISLSLLNALLQYIGYLLEVALSEGQSKKKLLELLGIAWVIHFTIWSQIFISFFSVTHNAERKIPKAVYSIVIVLFLLFSSFGVLQTLWISQVITDYQKVELGYVILSLTAKMFLSFMTFFGVLRGDQR